MSSHSAKSRAIGILTNKYLHAMKSNIKALAQMLDLSTGHYSKSTNDLIEFYEAGIEDNETLPVRWTRHEYGFIFWPIEPDDEQDWTPAPELEAINAFAYEQGCILVNFDRDGDVTDQFPTYEW